MPQKLNLSALAAEKLWHDLPRHSDEKTSFEPTKGQTPFLSFSWLASVITGGEDCLAAAPRVWKFVPCKLCANFTRLIWLSFN